MSELDPCIVFEHVGKAYRRQHIKPFLLRDKLLGRTGEFGDADWFWALRELSFSAQPGEAVAVLGNNGSGKSTTLRLLAGASYPTEGKVSVRGRVAPVLALGVGFEPDMNATENAYINASLLGVARDDVEARIQEILAFAELGEFEDVPVRHYSSGMLARLGFGVAMHVDADVLLIDEVLAVGDGSFQQKCLTRIRALADQGRTLVMVTHDLPIARELCDRAIWIRRGRLEADGPAAQVIDDYAAALGRGDG
ncbi:MAG: ABC transporter ATP-binding protein [Myxococcales bacterium]|nr:ABC transporter ATP-binding protein [Myxococcales bacterium]